jgi:hypothetical protein
MLDLEIFAPMIVCATFVVHAVAGSAAMTDKSTPPVPATLDLRANTRRL